MKKLIFTLIVLLPLSIFSQAEQKPPRLDFESNFTSDYYTLDNKRVSSSEIKLHLKKYSPNALNHYKAANAYAYTSLGFSIVGLGSATWYLIESTKKPTTITAYDSNNKRKAAALAITGLVVCFGLVFYLAAKSKYEKTKKTYNQQYGY